MDNTPDALSGTSDLRLGRRDRIVVVAVATVAGGALGLGLPHLLGWVEQLPWFPFEGPRQLLRALSGRLGSWILAVLGVAVGLGLGLLAVSATTRIEITDREIVVVPEGKDADRRRFARAEVDRALIEDRHLVLRDARDVDLGRWKLEVADTEVIAALEHHGWPHGPRG